MDAPAIDATTWYVDTKYQGHPHLIATGVLETDAGLVLVDPGPTTSLDTLERTLQDQGVAREDLHAVFLTHIHLDHAGATGTLVDRAPHLTVYVHERGAPHMARPERLLRSARRIYGDQMDDLWGAFRAVPDDNLHVLSGGETLTIGGRTLEVAYTPGHAQHHISAFDRASGTAFIGDVGGMRVAGADYLVPVMPPPDVDVPAWHDSLRTVRNWAPERLFLTHFGPHTDVDRHLDVMAGRVTACAEAVRHTLDSAEHRSAEALAARFAEKELDRMRAATDEAYWTAYERFGQPRDTWHGLARYWRTRAQAGPD